ncbi:uncharacterized protein EI90DRAFT_478674 [Cantharellus anzutake]|uniref:uncharacterized protein n=1 Tax=Cantharellus anzutake TaxID=1750568 RepID=UPI001903D093|nr:uncharacterized protein EI90DRAFT_478674 [Cantharellus anzutake]KAF8313954.1 hypothetical protein EI90DRAFT_478674 [Cantharellus anzutake]
MRAPRGSAQLIVTENEQIYKQHWKCLTTHGFRRVPSTLAAFFSADAPPQHIVSLMLTFVELRWRLILSCAGYFPPAHRCSRIRFNTFVSAKSRPQTDRTERRKLSVHILALLSSGSIRHERYCCPSDRISHLSAGLFLIFPHNSPHRSEYIYSANPRLGTSSYHSKFVRSPQMITPLDGGRSL